MSIFGIDDDRIESLARRIRELESKVDKMERESYVYADKYPECSTWEPLSNRHQRVSLQEAMSAVLRHCGILLKYESPTAGKLIVEKAKK